MANYAEVGDKLEAYRREWSKVRDALPPDDRQMRLISTRIDVLFGKARRLIDRAERAEQQGKRWLAGYYLIHALRVQHRLAKLGKRVDGLVR